MNSDFDSKADNLLAELDAAIRKYHSDIAKLYGVHNEGDYISSWALVTNYGNLNAPSPIPINYEMELYPPTQAPHSAKGLFIKGSELVDEMLTCTCDDED